MASPSQSNLNQELKTTKWFEKSHVIAIGIDNYTSPIEFLKTAAKDAEAIANILKKEHGFEGQLLLDGNASKKNITQAIADLKVGKNDRLVFYYAGHGIALPSEDDPQGYLIPQDAKYGDDSTYLAMSDLLKNLSKIDLRHVLIILDCCYAGAIRWSVSARPMGREKTIYPSTLDLYINSKSWQILTSSGEDQQANDVMLKNDRDKDIEVSNLGQHSPFAHFLIRGLQGEADLFPPGVGDNIITADELHLYLRNVDISTSQKGYRKRQTPQLLPIAHKHEKGEFVFLRNNKNLESIKAHLTPDPTIDDEHNPYRGLESYEVRHANCFFGRTRAIEELCDQVMRDKGSSPRLTVVLGGSGSGKSSLVKAGLIPHLTQTLEELNQSKLCVPSEETQKHYRKKQHQEVMNQENVQVIRPGKFPAQELKQALDRLERAIASGAKCLLVIDQFEEVETQCRNEPERKKFWRRLVSLLGKQQSKNNLYLILTLRSDFESTLRNKFETAWKKPLDWVAARFIVQPMEPQELQEVIEGPAAVKGVYFTSEKKNDRTLVQQLVNEVAGMPGGLPLLSFALQEIYRELAKEFVEANREGRDSPKREIGWRHYDALKGGVTQSITRRATEEYEKLEFDDEGKLLSKEDGEACQRMLRWIMLRMVAISGGGLARRSVLMSELDYPEPHNQCVEKVISRFADRARLLIKDKNEQGEYVEPAHDALIREWVTMKQWINKIENFNQADLSLQQRLTMNAAANEWNKNRNTEGEKGYLWSSNAYLPLLENLMNSDDNWLNQLELAFVKASVEERDRQLKESLEKKIEIDITESQMHFNANDRLYAVVKLIETGKYLQKQEKIRIDEHQEIQLKVKFNCLLSELGEFNSIDVGDRVQTFSCNENAKVIATVSGRSFDTLSFYDWTGRLIQKTEKNKQRFYSLAFSLNGETLVAGGEDGIIRFYKRDSDYSYFFYKTQDDATKHSGIVYRVKFSPDGTFLVAVDSERNINFWNQEGHFIDRLSFDFPWPIGQVAFSPKDNLIAFTDELQADKSKGLTIKIWKYKSYPRNNNTLFKSDNVETDEPLYTIPTQHNGLISAVHFSPNGKTLVSGDTNGTLYLWGITQDTPPQLLAVGQDDNQSSISDVAFSPDGRIVASSHSNGIINFWSIQITDEDAMIVQKLQQIYRLEGHKDKISEMSFSLISPQLFSSSYDGSVKFWSFRDSFQGHLGDKVQKISFSANNQIVMTVDERQRLKLWYSTGTLIAEFKDNDNKICDAQLSQGNEIFTAVTGDDEIEIKRYSLEWAELNSCFAKHGQPIDSLYFSSVGNTFVTINGNNTVSFWKLNNDPFRIQLLRTLSGHLEKITAITFSADGKFLATGSENGIIKIWSFGGDSMLEPPSIVKTIAAVGGSVTHLSLDDDGSVIGIVIDSTTDVSATDEYKIKLYQCQNGAFNERWCELVTHQICAIKVYKDKMTTVLIDDTGCIDIRSADGTSLATMSLLSRQALDSKLDTAAFSSNGEKIALAFCIDDRPASYRRIQTLDLNLASLIDAAYKRTLSYIQLKGFEV